MSAPEPETWWVLKPLPRGVRIALWVGGVALFALWASRYAWPVSRQLLTEGAPEPPVRDLGVFLLGLAVFALFGLIAGGVWVFLKLQSEFKKLHEEEPRA